PAHLSSRPSDAGNGAAGNPQNGNAATAGATSPTGPASPALTAHGGTFDVQVQAPPATPASDVSSSSRDMEPTANVIPPGGSLPPAPSASDARIEQMLVTSQAPPAADQVRVENGAIVLTSSSTSAPGAAHALGSGPPADPGPPTGVGNGNPGGNGNGNAGGNGNGNSG